MNNTTQQYLLIDATSELRDYARILRFDEYDPEKQPYHCEMIIQAMTHGFYKDLVWLVLPIYNTQKQARFHHGTPEHDKVEE